MAIKGKIITFRLPDSLHSRLQEQAAVDGTTISDVARSIVEQHVQISAVLTRIDDLDIGRRFREIYGQTRCAIIGLDALARASLGNGYDAWLAEVQERMSMEVKKKKEEVKTK